LKWTVDQIKLVGRITFRFALKRLAFSFPEIVINGMLCDRTQPSCNGEFLSAQLLNGVEF